MSLLSPRLILGRVGANDLLLTTDGYRYLESITPTDAARTLFDDETVVAMRATLGFTDWVAYTPTLTGFGTGGTPPTGLFFESRRVGDTLYIRGKFTSGTPTATEARITLGYNGTNANVNSDAIKVPSIMIAGFAIRQTAAAGVWTALIESNVGYLTFGAQNAGNAGLTKQLGNALMGVGEVFAFNAEVPISGW